MRLPEFLLLFPSSLNCVWQLIVSASIVLCVTNFVRIMLIMHVITHLGKIIINYAALLDFLLFAFALRCIQYLCHSCAMSI